MKNVFVRIFLLVSMVASLGATSVVSAATPAPKSQDYSKAAYVSLNLEDKGYSTITLQLAGTSYTPCGNPQNGWCYYTLYKHQLSNGFYNWTMSPRDGTGDALWLNYGEYRVGLVIDGKWQTPNEVYANTTELECLNAQSQFVFTTSHNPDPTTEGNSAISVACDNIPHLMNVDLAYAPLDHSTKHTVSFYSTLNGWKEVKANVNTSNGVYWYHYQNVEYNRGNGDATQWIMGAMIDGKWYTGDNLYANGVLLTCRDDAKGQVQFKINADQKIRTICENIPHRANINITYVPRPNEKNVSPSILGSFNGWKPQVLTAKNTDGNYVLTVLDIEIGSYAFGYLINNAWRSDAGQSWVNGTQITSTNAQHQLTFCLGNDWKVKNGNCQ